jgi:hypothetical protein
MGFEDKFLEYFLNGAISAVEKIRVIGSKNREFGRIGLTKSWDKWEVRAPQIFEKGVSIEEGKASE